MERKNKNYYLLFFITTFVVVLLYNSHLIKNPAIISQAFIMKISVPFLI
jgi:hypothetical protein